MKSLNIEKLSPRILLHGENETNDFPDFNNNTLIDHKDLEVWSEEFGNTLNGSDFLNWQRQLGHITDDNGSPHQDDSVKLSEHNELFDLVPRTAATHIAVNNGSWNDSSTWLNQQVPDDGADVLILRDASITIDSELTARLHTVRVDGDLIFANNVDTQLLVDTIIIDTHGHLEIGTEENPIQDDVTVKIVFTDNGQIDTNWDKTLISRGMIVHGSSEIYGVIKTAHTEITTDLTEGTNVIVTSEPVEGWKIGDRILIPAVNKAVDNNAGNVSNEDEIVQITSISPDQQSITIDTPLQYDHLKPSQDFRLPIANLDRNVMFSSENTTDFSRFGHVMFMHNPNTSLNYTSFDRIGRNSKFEASTDPQLDNDGNLIPSTAVNPNGRYAVHFHRAGSNNSQAFVQGTVVANNPGWGYVNHDSNVLFQNNISYNIKGAGFVSEIGTERGAFINNFAVRSVGKNFSQHQGASDKGEREGFGSAGHGFWLQSAQVALINNVAANHAQEGIFIHGRQFTEFGRDLPADVDLSNIESKIAIDFSAGQDDSFENGKLTVEQTPLAEVRGNESFGAGAGFQIRWKRRAVVNTDTDSGDLIEDMKIWNVKWAGMHMAYVSNINFKNITILGDIDNPISITDQLANNRETETRGTHAPIGNGISANRNSKDLTFENLDIRGFYIGIRALTQSYTSITNSTFSNVEDILVVTPHATEQSNDLRRVYTDNITHIPLSPQALNGNTHYDLRLLRQLDRTPVAGGNSAAQEWAGFTASDKIYYNGYRVYFEEQAPNAVPFPANKVPDFMSNAPYSQYIGKTNQQLINQYGITLGEEMAPNNTISLNDVGGIAISENFVSDQMSFDLSNTVVPSVWGLDEDISISWTTNNIDENVTWKAFLVNENGSHEIARTNLGIDNNELNVNLSQIPSVLDEVGPGQYSLIVTFNGKSGFYLGQVVAENHLDTAIGSLYL